MKATPRPSFLSHTPLRGELKRRVDEYFTTTGLARTGGLPMFMKTITILLWVGISYALLLFWATTIWQAVPLAISLGMALAGVGFSVMHDGGHASYSKKRWVNRVMAFSLDVLGGSSYFWNQKHNVLHHTYTNIDAVDDDIEIGPFMRLSAGQPRYWFHRFQFLYWVPLFCLFSTKWIFVDDFVTLATAKVGHQSIPRPRGLDLFLLFVGKALFATWAFVVPLLLVPVAPFLACYAVTAMVLGVVLGAVFQLAHAVENVEFVAAPEPGVPVQSAWVEHQIATTADFAMNNPFVTWYVGGLNFQVEHHLYPRVGHRHYPAIAKIVREVCAERGITVHENRTFLGALLAHERFLWRMGRPSKTETPSEPATTAEPATVAEPAAVA